jgi:hypothetical protein
MWCEIPPPRVRTVIARRPPPVRVPTTYSTAGGVLTTAHDGTTDQTQYCVTGDQMTQAPDLSNAAGSDPMTIG